MWLIDLLCVWLFCGLVVLMFDFFLLSLPEFLWKAVDEPWWKLLIDLTTYCLAGVLLWPMMVKVIIREVRKG